ncbi:methyl-accepting chemotaxis protein [Massilia sp. METH4]|uniref:methyl-accepting chemotaxis protein n=1 Tax=Massilia sp. METH4 TaxID=3123041 RepID=UPI0030D2E43A
MKNMKVGTRLAAGYGLVLLLLSMIVGTGVVQMGEMQARIENITDIKNVQISHVTALRSSVNERMIALRNLALLVEDKTMRPEVERIRQQETRYGGTVARLAASFRDAGATAEEKALLATIQEQERVAVPLMKQAEDLALAMEGAEAGYALMYRVRPVQRVWVNAMNDLITLEEKLNVANARQAKETYQTAVNLMLALGVVAFLAGIGAATFVTRSLLRQLGGEPETAAVIAARIADGDLTVDVPVKAGDTGSMMLAMRDMRDKLAAIVTEVRAGTDTIATAASEVSDGNLDLSARTEQQAGALEETASSMEELTSTVRQNAENAQQASAMAASASEVAVQGGAVVAKVVDTMDAIDAAAKKIVDIIAVIDGIAFQTNILALNAAVEAARAGEQGRGFAVVAGEVRNLAHRAAAAAKEIKELIDDSVEKVGVGTQLVGRAGATMQEIVGSVQRVTDIMTEISAASREQSCGIDQVNKALASMDEVTQQNAALVEQASAASEAMREQAATLAALVNTFTIAQATAPAAAPRLAVPKALAPAAPAPLPAAPAKAATPRRAAPRKVANGDTVDWEEF